MSLDGHLLPNLLLLDIPKVSGCILKPWWLSLATLCPEGLQPIPNSIEEYLSPYLLLAFIRYLLPTDLSNAMEPRRRSFRELPCLFFVPLLPSLETRSLFLLLRSTKGQREV